VSQSAPRSAVLEWAAFDHPALAGCAFDRLDYASTFGGDVLDDLPQLAEVTALGLAAWHGPALRLNAAGRAASDGIGQWLQSAEVAALRAAWTPR